MARLQAQNRAGNARQLRCCHNTAENSAKQRRGAPLERQSCEQQHPELCAGVVHEQKDKKKGILPATIPLLLGGPAQHHTHPHHVTSNESTDWTVTPHSSSLRRHTNTTVNVTSANHVVPVACNAYIRSSKSSSLPTTCRKFDQDRRQNTTKSMTNERTMKKEQRATTTTNEGTNKGTKEGTTTNEGRKERTNDPKSKIESSFSNPRCEVANDADGRTDGRTADSRQLPLEHFAVSHL